MNKYPFYSNQSVPDKLNTDVTIFNDEDDLIKRLTKAIETKETIYALCNFVNSKTGKIELSFIDGSNIIGYVLASDITYKKHHNGRSVDCLDSIIGIKILEIEEEIDGLRMIRCSRKEVVQEIRDKYNKDIQDGILKDGLMVRGIVTGMDPGKVFVDLGGDVTAILGVADITRVYLRHPSDAIENGQVLELAVKKVYPIDGDKPMHISLSRAMLLDGWENMDRRFRAGGIVPGIIKNRMATGIFIELSESFEGLAEDIPAGVKYNYGDRVKVSILTVDKKREKIKLRIIENR